MTYYFTSNADGSKIDSDARIRSAATKREVIERMQECEKGLAVVDIVEGDFGDCFAKFTREPTADDLQRLSDEYGIPLEAFNVRAPGTHPGGRMWWIDVTISVFVPVYKAGE